MIQKPPFLKQGERARLFPVLSENSKEGRALSIFLSCMSHVDEFGSIMMSSIGKRVGTRSKVTAYTEVTFQQDINDKSSKQDRPDGLISITLGKKTFYVLVEAKIGNNGLTSAQVESYIELATKNNIDAVVTISNDFSALPQHHPIAVNKRLLKKVELFHWSWMFILTQADLLLKQGKVLDHEQAIILKEFIRFISHQSTGIRGFDRMPSEWPEVCRQIQAKGKLKKTDDAVRAVVAAWQQETKDLSLLLSRKIERECSLRLSRKHTSDHIARLDDDAVVLCERGALTCSIDVPNAAAPIDICADVTCKQVEVSMKLQAPADKKTAKSRISWLLKQLSKSKADNILIRAYWPGGKAHTQKALADLRNDPSAICDANNMLPTSFEVRYAKDLGANFNGNKKFIEELEAAVEIFYAEAAENLKKWQSPAPRISDKEQNKSSPAEIAESLEKELSITG